MFFYYDQVIKVFSVGSRIRELQNFFLYELTRM